MLGWDFPPRIKGGLGNASAALLDALGKMENVDVSFVVPQLFGDEVATSARLIALANEPLTLFPSLLAGVNGSYSQVLRDADTYAVMCEGRHHAFGIFDVIHAHDWLTFVAACDLKRATGKPLIAHIHSTEYDRASSPNPEICRIEQQGISAADAVLVVSEYSKSVLLEHYQVPAEKLFVVHNGTTFTDCGNTKRQPSGMVSFVGRITYQKGCEHFIEAARVVLDKIPTVKFTMAGDGDQVALVKSLIRSMSMRNSFILPGFISSKAVTAVLAQSDVFVMPSISEPFGIAAAEAIAMRVPTVLSRRSGIAEIVKSALHVNPFRPEEIAEAVIRVLVDAELASDLAAGAQAELAPYTWQVSALKIREVYAEVVGV